MSGSLILIIIVAYFSVLLTVSYLTGRKTGNRTFFTADKQSRWYIIAFGMIGTTLSGVTFISVPGMVRSIDMTYMQMVLGFFVGYLFIANVLLPLYYRLNLTSIYTYLRERIGKRAYKTGASFFLLSRTIGAAVRIYLVAIILQAFVYDPWGIPFYVNVIINLMLIFLYTFRSGIKTIIWTDTLQALCMITMLILLIRQISMHLNLDFNGIIQAVSTHEHSRIFVFDDWQSKQNFFKQFFSGIFITIVMTGLDQDMMQKNLTCRSLKEAKRNMYSYGFAFVPINLLFLTLGVLLLMLAQQTGTVLPESGDQILPMFATNGMLGTPVLVFFTLGIIAASFASADSAIAALTTSTCIDILDIEQYPAEKAKRIRIWTHFLITVVVVIIILIVKEINSKSVIDAIYTIAAYTYGPLLGLFAFGMLTKRMTRDRFTPYICIASPLLAYALDYTIQRYTGYKFGYEILMINGLITFAGLIFFSYDYKRGEIRHQ
ncbi:MAG: sodium:solute symporter [Bacteroidales bacterium]|nr:sodium:solute symporter [Bacteroidales bacterium]